MMCRMLVLFALPWLVLGCTDASKGRRQAARCAETWKARGFDFDPDAMTCRQMFARAQATWKAQYWQKQGYVFDPATMTAEEMDRKARELQKARQTPPTGPTPPLQSSQAGSKADGNGTAPPGTSPSQAVAGGRNGASASIADDPKVEASLRKRLKGMTILDVRSQYPQYNDMGDMELARRIHAKYFSDTPFEEFARRFFGYRK